jgi:hypothetical protein
MGLHIAGAARISIQPPRAADTGFGFQDAKIASSRLLEPNRQSDTRKSGANDEQLML